MRVHGQGDEWRVDIGACPDAPETRLSRLWRRVKDFLGVGRVTLAAQRVVVETFPIASKVTVCGGDVKFRRYTFPVVVATLAGYIDHFRTSKKSHPWEWSMTLGQCRAAAARETRPASRYYQFDHEKFAAIMRCRDGVHLAYCAEVTERDPIMLEAIALRQMEIAHVVAKSTHEFVYLGKKPEFSIMFGWSAPGRRR